MSSRKRYVRLYIKWPDTYWRVEFSNGVNRIPVTILMTTTTLTKNKRGFPFECILAHGVDDFAKEHPDAFPHKVMYVYVTKSSVYIVDRFKNGQPSHAMRYQHSFAKMVGTFDRMTKEHFIAKYNGVGFTLTLCPGRKYRKGESVVGGNGSGGSRAHKISRGAMERAQAAGLVPMTSEMTA